MKLEKNWANFLLSQADAMSSKNTKMLSCLALPESSFDIFLIVLQEHFVYE